MRRRRNISAQKKCVSEKFTGSQNRIRRDLERTETRTFPEAVEHNRHLVNRKRTVALESCVRGENQRHLVLIRVPETVIELTDAKRTPVKTLRIESAEITRALSGGALLSNLRPRTRPVARMFVIDMTVGKRNRIPESGGIENGMISVLRNESVESCVANHFGTPAVHLLRALDPETDGFRDESGRNVVRFEAGRILKSGSAQFRRTLRIRSAGEALPEPLRPLPVKIFILFRKPLFEFGDSAESAVRLIVEFHQNQCRVILPRKPGIRVDVVQELFRAEFETPAFQIAPDRHHQLVHVAAAEGSAPLPVILVEPEGKNNVLPADSLFFHFRKEKIPAVEHLRIEFHSGLRTAHDPVVNSMIPEEIVTLTANRGGNPDGIFPELLFGAAEPELLRKPAGESLITGGLLRSFFKHEDAASPRNRTPEPARRSINPCGEVESRSGLHFKRLHIDSPPFRVFTEDLRRNIRTRRTETEEPSSGTAQHLHFQHIFALLHRKKNLMLFQVERLSVSLCKRGKKRGSVQLNLHPPVGGESGIKRFFSVVLEFIHEKSRAARRESGNKPVQPDCGAVRRKIRFLLYHADFRRTVLPGEFDSPVFRERQKFPERSRIRRKRFRGKTDHQTVFLSGFHRKRKNQTVVMVDANRRFPLRSARRKVFRFPAELKTGWNPLAVPHILCIDESALRNHGVIDTHFRETQETAFSRIVIPRPGELHIHCSANRGRQGETQFRRAFVRNGIFAIERTLPQFRLFPHLRFEEQIGIRGFKNRSRRAVQIQTEHGVLSAENKPCGKQEKCKDFHSAVPLHEIAMT